MGKSEWNLGWNDDAKVAAIYYCYLSLDKTDNEEKKKHLAALFDPWQKLDWYLSTLGLKALDEKPPESDNDWETFLKNNPDVLFSIVGGWLPQKSAQYFAVPNSLAFDNFSNVKEEITGYCDEVIAKFAEDERYECIVEEMDRLAADNYSGFFTFNSRKYLWEFVFHSVGGGILAGEKMKYLSHFCRIAGLEKTVLLEMEKTAISIIAIGKKRLEAKASDETYSKVVDILHTLETEELALHEKVKNLLETKPNDENDDEPCEEKIYEPWADEDSSLIEKLGGALINVFDGIADGLGELAAKL
ncbi:hypothetical protein AGMMS49587_13590 [Spirochaetia bacterium]|nr:hypothetical protein AGMMS49587_13590 [Spirochaetia bacterium]